MIDEARDPTAILDAPASVAVTELIRAWAARAPTSIAVAQGTATVTYGQLLRAIDALGHTLAARVPPGAVIAVTGEPSFALIVAMCAVLDRGCVLVPLDPGLPSARLRGMVRDAAAALVIDAGGAAATELGVPVLPASIGDRDPEAQRHPVSSASPAYVFFTSGTTGKPKGIVGNHKGLSHFLGWQRERFAIGPGDRCAQLTGLSFDVVMRAVFQPLGSGATLCLPDAGITAASDQVVPWLARERITLVHVVPSLARHWLDTAGDAVLPALRHSFFAGEVLTDVLVRRWRALAPSSAVINLYGPTETTLAKCYFVVPDEPRAGIQPVGRPLPHTQALVLTADRQLAATGEPGEVYIRTPFRSNGYLGDHPDRVRFVRNPFRDDPDDVLYQTGDRGELTIDGDLVVRGRIDDQVKINGVRVEPAEVTATLTAIAGVRAAEVLARGDDERRMLVAYVVVEPPRPRDAAALRTELARTLPAALVPAAFVFLDALPLTANGKVDRGALPAPHEHAAEPVAPRDPVEAAIATIWSRVLRRDRIGVDDNFFALGGDSLRSVTVMHELRTELGVEPSPRLLFDAPTIAELAAVVRRSPRGASGDVRGAPPADRSPHATVVASPAQRACWNVQRGDPKNPAAYIRTGIDLEGALDLRALDRSLAAVVRRHGSLRTAYAERDGTLWQQLLDPADVPPIAIERIELASAEELARRQIDLIAHLIEQIDLARGVCASAALVRIEPDRHVLLIVVHHISFDAASESILLDDLAAAYANPEAALDESPFRYIDYAHELAIEADSPAGHDQRDYWIDRLAGAPALALPVDGPREALDARRDAARGGFVSLRTRTSTAMLSAVERERLRELAVAERATMYIVMLAAFSEFLGQVTGQRDLCVQSIFGRRHDLRTERMTGFFANPLVLRIDTANADDVHALIARTTQSVLAATEHGAVAVVELAPHELRRVNFNYVAATHPAPLASLGTGLTASRWSTAEPVRTPFDLHFGVVDRLDGVHLTLLASATLFEHRTADRLLQAYAAVLARWARGADKR